MRALALLITLSSIACGSCARNRLAESPTQSSSTKQEAHDDNEWGHWTDDDNDCQNTREEVLIKQSEVPVSFKTEKQCEVNAGRWTCPFTGEVFTDPRALTVTRVVPLTRAIAAGAQAWKTERKVANEMGENSHLIVVSVSAEEARAKRDPDSWLPDNEDYVCEYLQTWIKTKMHYELATDRKVLKLHTAQCLGPVKFCGKTWPLETTEISCDDPSVKSLRPLARLKSLKWLQLLAIDHEKGAYLSNQVTDLKPLAALTNLAILILSSGELSDITPLATLTNLRHLQLNNSKVSDLKPLSGLDQLERLLLDGTPVTDLAPLVELTSLYQLSLKGTKVSEFEPLAKLIKLSRLDISATQISDLEPLTKIPTLHGLDLSATQISDLGPLVKLKGLVHLVLNDMPISDLQPLAKIASLEKLDLKRTVVPKSQIKKLRKAKPNLEIDF